MDYLRSTKQTESHTRNTKKQLHQICGPCSMVLTSSSTKKKIQKKVAKWCRKVDLSVNFMIHGREWKWGIRNSAMCPTRNFVMVVFLGFFCNSCLETLEYLCKLGLLVRVKYSFLASAEFYRNACSYEKIIARPKRNQTCAYS